MGKQLNKFRDNRDKLALTLHTKKTPKKRCKNCGRYTLYAFEKKDGIVSKKGKCVFCGE